MVADELFTEKAGVQRQFGRCCDGTLSVIYTLNQFVERSRQRNAVIVVFLSYSLRLEFRLNVNKVRVSPPTTWVA